MGDDLLVRVLGDLSGFSRTIDQSAALVRRLAADVQRVQPFRGLQTGADSAVRGITSAFQAVEGRVGSIFGRLTSSVNAQLAAIVGGGALVTYFTRTVMEGERLTAQLRTVTGTAEGAADAFQQMGEFAQATPFQVEEATRAFITLRTRGVDPTTETLTRLADMASAFGGRIDELAMAATQAAFGETERLKAFGVAAQVTGDQLILTYDGIRQVVPRSAAAVVAALEEISRVRFAGAAEREMQTLGGAFATLQDALANLARELGQAGVSDEIARMVRGLAELTATLAKNRAAFAVWVAQISNQVTRGIDEVVTGFRTIAREAAAMAEAMSRPEMALGPFAQLRGVIEALGILRRGTDETRAATERLTAARVAGAERIQALRRDAEVSRAQRADVQAMRDAIQAQAELLRSESTRAAGVERLNAIIVEAYQRAGAAARSTGDVQSRAVQDWLGLTRRAAGEIAQLNQRLTIQPRVATGADGLDGVVSAARVATDALRGVNDAALTLVEGSLSRLDQIRIDPITVPLDLQLDLGSVREDIRSGLGEVFRSTELDFLPRGFLDQVNQAIAGYTQARDLMEVRVAAGLASDAQAATFLANQYGVVEQALRSVTEELTRQGYSAGQIDAVFATLRDRLAGLQAPARASADEMGRFAESFQGLSGRARGIAEIVGSFTGLSREAGTAARAISLVASGIDSIRMVSTTGGFAGLVGSVSGVGALISGAVGLLGTLFGGSDARSREHAQILEANNRALDDLGLKLSDFGRGVADISRAQQAAAALAVDDRLAQSVQAVFGGTFGSSMQRANDEVVAAQDETARILRQFGLSMEDLNAVAQANGIQLLDSRGRLVAGAMDDLARALDLTIQQAFRFGNTLADQTSLASTRRDVLDVTSPLAEIQDQLAIFQRLAPELFDQFFTGINVTTEEGRRRLEEETRRFFERFQLGTIDPRSFGGFQSGGEVLQWVRELESASDRYAQEAQGASGAMRNAAERLSAATARMNDWADIMDLPDDPIRNLQTALQAAAEAFPDFADSFLRGTDATTQAGRVEIERRIRHMYEGLFSGPLSLLDNTLGPGAERAMRDALLNIERAMDAVGEVARSTAREVGRFGGGKTIAPQLISPIEQTIEAQRRMAQQWSDLFNEDESAATVRRELGLMQRFFPDLFGRFFRGFENFDLTSREGIEAADRALQEAFRAIGAGLIQLPTGITLDDVAAMFANLGGVLDTARSSIDGLGESADRASRELMNVPTGFRIALAEFEATLPDLSRLTDPRRAATNEPPVERASAGQDALGRTAGALGGGVDEDALAEAITRALVAGRMDDGGRAGEPEIQININAPLFTGGEAAALVAQLRATGQIAPVAEALVAELGRRATRLKGIGAKWSEVR